MHKRHRLNHYLWRPTTFFPELDVPVKMNEAEDVPGPTVDAELPSTSHSNYLLPGNYSENNDTRGKSDVDCQLDLLKRIKHEKQRISNADGKIVYHFGFKVSAFLRVVYFFNKVIFSVTFVMRNQSLEQDGIVLPA